MGALVCGGAQTMCSMGSTPSSLMVLPTNKVAGSMPYANIMDSKPMVNILPFGMCMTPSNPAVASATAAALGVLTPAPCVPATATPWAPGSPTVLINNMPALNNSSKAMCSYGGLISVVNPGQFAVQVP